MLFKGGCSRQLVSPFCLIYWLWPLLPCPSPHTLVCFSLHPLLGSLSSGRQKSGTLGWITSQINWEDNWAIGSCSYCMPLQPFWTSLPQERRLFHVTRVHFRERIVCPLSYFGVGDFLLLGEEWLWPCEKSLEIIFQRQEASTATWDSSVHMPMFIPGWTSLWLRAQGLMMDRLDSISHSVPWAS